MGSERVRLGGTFVLTGLGPDREVKWVEEAKNLVPNVALQHLINTGILTATQVSKWYVAPTAATPVVAAADTMGGHSGWTEFTGYSQTVRQSWTGARSGQVISNAAALASMAITTTGTLGGAFIVSDSTKGGATGVLFCGGANTGSNRSVSSGDTVTVRYSFTAADDGV